jgi:hypothetical protein
MMSHEPTWVFFRATRNFSRCPAGFQATPAESLDTPFGMVVADGAAMTDNLCDRVRGEYREMPGLRLTVAQAARLFNLDHAQCGQLLDTLVTDGALCTNGREYFGANAGRKCA